MKVWIVLADGEHVRVVTPSDAHGQFTTAASFDSAFAHRRSQDLGTDRPGRSFESANSARHAITPRQDPHKAAKHDFILEVAKQVDTHAEANDFDQLVLVAPGHALHDLRKALGANATARIVGSLVKDLTKTRDHELTSHLAEWWLRPTAAA
jgi:protein required for attachment to host cells